MSLDHAIGTVAPTVSEIDSEQAKGRAGSHRMQRVLSGRVVQNEQRGSDRAQHPGAPGERMSLRVADVIQRRNEGQRQGLEEALVLLKHEWTDRHGPALPRMLA